MNRQEKAQQVDELRELFDGAQVAILTKYEGLDVPGMVKLRSELRKASGGYRVVKNTLARLAMEGTPFEALSARLKGAIGVVVSKEDAAAVAKVVTDFAKESKRLEIEAALLPGGRLLTADGVEQLARLPGKDQLRAMLLGALVGVPRKFLGVLQAPARDFVGVLEARRRQLAGE